MSFRTPVSAPISQKFGVDFQYDTGKKDKNGKPIKKWYYKDLLKYLGHNGVDYSAKANTPVYAADEGQVVFEGWGKGHPWMGEPAGICVLIDHFGSYAGYAHLSKTVINKGQKVKKGQLIGYVGSTGSATGHHLHFEMIPYKVNFKNGYAGRIDPTKYMDKPKAIVKPVITTAQQLKSAKDKIALLTKEKASLKASRDKAQSLLDKIKKLLGA